VKTPDSFAALHSLAAGLCQDVDLRLERGPGWAFSPALRTLYVPDDALERFGVDGCAGVVAHEVGHALLSRYTEFRDVPESDILVRNVLNALEDPRVEEWMGRRYPGARLWLDRLHATQPDVYHWIPTIQLMLAFVREGWWHGRGQEAPASALSYAPEVGAALERTRAARRAYVRDFLPDVNLQGAPADVLALHEASCSPQLLPHASRWPSTQAEAWVRVLARRAVEVALESVVPEVRACFESDARTIAGALARHPELADLAHQGIASGSGQAVSQVIRSALGESEPEVRCVPSEHDLELARRLLKWILGERPRPSASAASAASRGRLLSPREVEAVMRAGRVDLQAPLARDPLQNEIDRCVAALEEALVPRRRLGVRAGYASGTRLDLRRAMAHVADRRRPIDFWTRTSAPTRRSAAFLLLVDLSGSMRGDKIKGAISGARLFAETLTRLGIPFSIAGFQDRVIEVLPFGAPFDDAAREALKDLRLEVAGKRPGGNNNPLYNDDGPCLGEAAEALLRRGEDDRVLLVLSDGRPEGSRSTADDLTRAVARLSKELSLVGLGIGPGTEHVRDFYPHHLASIPLESLPRRIGDVLRACITGGVASLTELPTEAASPRPGRRRPRPAPSWA
jgi:Mg-chelatase subunit ChlD